MKFKEWSYEMNVILLSGGSGKRLWPLSNEVRSKQFLKIFKNSDGSHESMIQRMFRMLRNVAPEATITIATSANQVPQIKAQLGEAVGISIEPCRRDTFPAIALTTAYRRRLFQNVRKTSCSGRKRRSQSRTHGNYTDLSE